MRAKLSASWSAVPGAGEADGILRACVHCGFCNAVCPTYALTGDECDGPRGRIYLIKSLLEGEPAAATVQTHLDRCLTCRACESTCPSGVRYARLLDFVRPRLNSRMARTRRAALIRWLLLKIVPHPRRFAAGLRLAQWGRWLAPARLRSQIPPRGDAQDWPRVRHARRLVTLEGCVQALATPAVNAAAARVLDRVGISLLRAPAGGCCGALPHHLGNAAETRTIMRANIDAWTSPALGDVEGIFCTASACSAMLKDYGELLADDPDYAERAAWVTRVTRDASELIPGTLDEVPSPLRQRKVAFQAPCTLLHVLHRGEAVEACLEKLGCELSYRGPQACCGSAGTYALLQAELSEQLLENKIAALEATDAEEIVTANIGCQLHLARASQRPVRHWVELVDELLSAR